MIIKLPLKSKNRINVRKVLYEAIHYTKESNN